MAIKFFENTRIFKITTIKSTYAFQILENREIVHLYYGAAIPDSDLSYLGRTEPHGGVCPQRSKKTDRYYSPDVMKSEISCNGSGDFRISALQIRQADGTNTTGVLYCGHRIYSGKPKIPGLPATYDNGRQADTLELNLKDPATGISVTLYYTAFENIGAITRHMCISNQTQNTVSIERAFSTCVDFENNNMEMLHLWGSWAKEFQAERQPLFHGIQTVSSKRGCSSHNHNPFVALVSADANEECGEAYGFSLVYSGNFAAEIELDSYGVCRVIMGIYPESFEWKLEPSEEFYTPECVMVYSDEGIGGMSRIYHQLYGNNLCRGKWKNKARPILLNTWEGTYFKFDEKLILEIAKESAKLGVELFVLDDGWFGKRDNSKTSLGDWFVDEKKIPSGIGYLGKEIRKLGMEFGLWFEPEMISPVSQLYENHPDWCLHITGREMSLGRDQLVLDMSRSDVRDYLFRQISKIIDESGLTYIKWDFNRSLTEVGSITIPKDRQKEIFHRYVLGLYDLCERLIRAYPDVLMEGCASGGGRFDAGMLYYFPQIWTSDDTDAAERMRIQYGASIVYPPSAISAHISAVPNHQTGRVSSLSTRSNTAFMGAFGLELNPLTLSEDEKKDVRKYIENYRSVRNLFVNCGFYRLINPFGTSDRVSWMFVSSDGSEALVYYAMRFSSLYAAHTVRLCGLDADSQYVSDADNKVYSGKLLMSVGLNFDRKFRDGESVLIKLKKIKPDTCHT